MMSPDYTVYYGASAFPSEEKALQMLFAGLFDKLLIFLGAPDCYWKLTNSACCCQRKSGFCLR